MRYRLLTLVACVLSIAMGCDSRTSGPTPIAPPAPAVPPVPPATPLPFPPIVVGQAIRFHFAPDDRCPSVGLAGCRSYAVTAPSDGEMEVALTAVSGENNAMLGLELYVVPGADYWNSGPGPRISARFPVRNSFSYEIRMGAAFVPSAELELIASMR